MANVRNTIEEQKSNYGANTSVGRDLGQHHPSAQSKGAPALPQVNAGRGLVESIDDALKGIDGQARDKAQMVDHSVKVGQEDDFHAKAAAKQP
ncbi:hypothetical protein LTR84_007438 [Exophiala bonariae]|uniref:SMP domain-containing protein n=1 Tax=Exophiala bonariae TaxID=1690606 RepID=A0AAV9MYH9_9EURO|nr:hypothetical protein LTR84_007438 [Exophiala bonariae]